MNRRFGKIFVPCLMVLILVTTLGVFGCGGGGAGGKTTIVIGSITDLTGPASSTMTAMEVGLRDLVRYLNEKDFIPGVKLKVVTYDTRMDASRDIPAYEWCKTQGARQLILCGLNPPAEVNKATAERDKIVIFALTGTKYVIDPPGWIFIAQSTGTVKSRVLLDYVSQQWDYVAKGRKPKLGSVLTNDPWGTEFHSAIKEYCQDHPDEFDYVKALLVPMSQMTFSGEVESVKDCDYVAGPGWGTPCAAFIKEFRQRGYTAKLITLDAMAPSIKFIEDYCGAEAFDGFLFMMGAGYWNESTSLVTLAKEILHKYHSSAYAEDTMALGNGYLSAIVQFTLGMDILKKTIEAVGTENFSGQAYYDTAKAFKEQYEGYPEWSFGETERLGYHYIKMYEYRANAGGVVAVSDWLPMQ